MAKQNETPAQAKRVPSLEDVLAAHSRLKDGQAAVEQTEKEVKGYTAKLAKRKTALAGVQAEYAAIVEAHEKKAPIELPDAE